MPVCFLFVMFIFLMMTLIFVMMMMLIFVKAPSPLGVTFSHLAPPSIECRTRL